MINKTLNPDDYQYLVREGDIIGKALSNLEWYDMQHPHRLWEYSKALSFIDSLDGIGTILDVGSGNSPFPAVLKFLGYEVECLEGMQKPAHIDQWGIKWNMVEDGGTIPFKPKSFDVVTSISVIEHIDDAEVAKSVLRQWIELSRVGLFLTFDSSSDGSRRVPHHYRSYTMAQMEKIILGMSDICKIVGEIDYTYYGDFVNNGNFGCMAVRRVN